MSIYRSGVPDEREPGPSVRRMGLDERAVGAYLRTTSDPAAVPIPDALGVLEHRELDR